MDSNLLYLLSTLYLIWIFRSFRLFIPQSSAITINEEVIYLIILYFITIYRCQKKAAKLVQDFTAGANEAVQETFSLMRTVRVYGTERKEFGRFKQWLVKVAFVNIRESVAYGFCLALWYKLHNDLASTLEQRAILENEMLCRQDEELRCLFPQTDHSVPSYLEYYPVEKEKSLVNHGVTNPDLVSNFAFENGDSDITLHLGYYSVLINEITFK
ncbi:unnamed protein product [Prunus armeniaca]|uniref:Uncharacterized protein n=1 Tax=Prunus armeniaca TaxID=36596 RepID=A0A6J5WAH6_PRUAR|nr:unnamed protein product [Prunus armeniaca]